MTHEPWQQLGPIRVPNAVDTLVDRIRSRILSGEIQAGSMLPPERSLSVQLGVSRNTVRGALARLVSEGLVSIRQGRGAEVQDFRSIGGLGLLARMPRELQNAMFPGVLELRLAVALELLTLVSERGSEAHFERLAALAEQIAQTQDPVAIADLDVEFSRVLCRAAGNLAMELILNSVGALYASRPDIPRILFEDRDDVRASYAAIVEVLRQRRVHEVIGVLRDELKVRDKLTLERLARSGQGGAVFEAEMDLRHDPATTQD